MTNTLRQLSIHVLVSAVFATAVAVPPAMSQASDRERAEVRQQKQQEAYAQANKAQVIAEIVATWEVAILDAGGHPSQLEMTLQAASAEAVAAVARAGSLAEINRILAP